MRPRRSRWAGVRSVSNELRRQVQAGKQPGNAQLPARQGRRRGPPPVQHSDVRVEAPLPRSLRDALRDWRLKALAFRVLEHLPMQQTAYKMLQRHVTRSYPREHSPTRETSASHQHHVRAFRERFGPLDAARLFEFGAGWDLYGNLVFWSLGI